MFAKIVTIALAGFLSSAALAAQPNVYNCVGANGSLLISYTSTSTAGTPTFNVSRSGRSLTSGPNLLVSIQHSPTPLGQFVSVIVTPRFTADVPSQLYGIFIPQIELSQQNQVAFTTEFLEGTIGGGRRAAVIGQQINAAYQVNCGASRRLF